ncbi:MAG: serine/threonine protein kinase [Chloroflexota bacterium]|nr:serine/threonine protein kinase [Chloroflexota bacterium]
MIASSFCDECGAALPAQVAVCVACGQPVDASSSAVDPARAPCLAPQIATSGTLPRDSLLDQRYRIVGLIGQGGFAHVYNARDTSHRNRLVAIKQISLRGLSAREMIEVTDSYNREIMYLSQLRHESLPRIYEHFTDADHWYIVMEYIRGETLEDRLKSARRGHFSVHKVLGIGYSLCKVLNYLHDQKQSIIFRDLKPANIMLTRKGRLYLIDFGIARQYRPQQRKDTAPLGSPGYAAPEQYGKAQTTIQTDVYGLGATLQTLLTGKEPLELLMSSEPPSHAVPQELQALITRMLEREPGKRPRSIEEVRWSLQQLQQNFPEQKARRMLVLLPYLLKQAVSLAILLGFMLSLSYLLFALVGFPFRILYLLLLLSLFVGRSVYYIRQERDTNSTPLSRKEMLGIICKRLPGSIFAAIFLAIFFLFLYALIYQSVSGG